MEAADGHREAALQELAGQIDRVGILVGLDADQANQARAAAALDLGHQVVRADAGIGLVDRVDDDVHVRPQDLPRAAILTETIERGQRVRGDV
jgi:hypothetical protein